MSHPVNQRLQDDLAEILDFISDDLEDLAKWSVWHEDRYSEQIAAIRKILEEIV